MKETQVCRGIVVKTFSQNIFVSTTILPVSHYDSSDSLVGKELGLMLYLALFFHCRKWTLKWSTFICLRKRLCSRQSRLLFFLLLSTRKACKTKKSTKTKLKASASKWPGFCRDFPKSEGGEGVKRQESRLKGASEGEKRQKRGLEGRLEGKRERKTVSQEKEKCQEKEGESSQSLSKW